MYITLNLRTKTACQKVVVLRTHLQHTETNIWYRLLKKVEQREFEHHLCILSIFRTYITNFYALKLKASSKQNVLSKYPKKCSKNIDKQNFLWILHRKIYISAPTQCHVPHWKTILPQQQARRKSTVSRSIRQIPCIFHQFKSTMHLSHQAAGSPAEHASTHSVQLHSVVLKDARFGKREKEGSTAAPSRNNEPSSRSRVAWICIRPGSSLSSREHKRGPPREVPSLCSPHR